MNNCRISIGTLRVKDRNLGIGMPQITIMRELMGVIGFRKG